MIALISDVHGNFEALKSVLAKIDELEIKDILCLGDVAGYYSQVNECCDELRRRNAKCIMGNHDWYMAQDTFCPRSKSANDCLEYQRKIITKENKEWIKTFPLIRNDYGISVVHGSWANPVDDYLQPEEEYFRKLKGNFFASGHCHVQRLEKYDGKIYCNPGSVGQPRDYNPNAAFATFDGKDFELFRVEYDINKVGELMEQAGFSGYYYECLKIGAPKLGFYNNI